MRWRRLLVVPALLAGAGCGPGLTVWPEFSRTGLMATGAPARPTHAVRTWEDDAAVRVCAWAIEAPSNSSVTTA